MLNLQIARGRSLPLGATAQADGVNFSLLCRHGTAAFLVIYPLDKPKPITEIALHPKRNRTGDVWHVLVAGLPPAFGYGWRVDGPSDPGHCYNANQVLLDPAATALSNGSFWGRSSEPDPRTTSRHSIFLRRPFNWQEDVPPLTHLEDTLIYEMHVRGFTWHPSAQVRPSRHVPGAGREDTLSQIAGCPPPSSYCPSTSLTRTTAPSSNPLTRRTAPRKFWGCNSIALRGGEGGLRQQRRGA